MSQKKYITPIKSIKGPSLTYEKSEDLEFWLSQLKKNINEMDGSILKKVDFSGSQENIKREMEKKMNENEGGM